MLDGLKTKIYLLVERGTCLFYIHTRPAETHIDRPNILTEGLKTKIYFLVERGTCLFYKHTRLVESHVDRPYIFTTKSCDFAVLIYVYSKNISQCY